jgi:gamma-glutamylcyclotransferase (GGCT)/AIG2-like uncharacterized protein YtfP
MKHRISKARENPDELRTFFLACEFKPNTPMFSVLDPFAYDIKPAFIYGSLGVISYTGNERHPECYSVIDADEGSSPLLGYIVTITEPDTVNLLDKIKGVYGEDAFNTHQKRTVKAYTDIKVSHNAWCYVLSESVLEQYEQIEQVEFGLWDEEDDDQVNFLEKIGDAF